MKDKLKVGIIGLGGISGVHLRNLCQMDRAKITCVCDIDPVKTQAKAKDLNAKGYTNFEEMLDKESVEAVVLLTPQMVREGPIGICARKKIPVFTEKPPASDMETARRIAQAVKFGKIIVSVGFVFRYMKAVKRIRSLLKGRPILAMQLQYLCPMMYSDSRGSDFYYNKQLSGGLLIDQAIHLLDFCRFMLEDEVVQMNALGANILQPKTKKITTEETIIMNMKTKSGKLANYLHTWTHRGWQARVEIFAVDAKIVLDPFNKRFTGVVDGMDVAYAPEDDYYKNEMESFLEAVAAHKPEEILSTYEDSVKTLELAFKLNESMERS